MFFYSKFSYINGKLRMCLRKIAFALMVFFLFELRIDITPRVYMRQIYTVDKCLTNNFNLTFNDIYDVRCAYVIINNV